MKVMTKDLAVALEVFDKAMDSRDTLNIGKILNDVAVAYRLADVKEGPWEVVHRYGVHAKEGVEQSDYRVRREAGWESIEFQVSHEATARKYAQALNSVEARDDR